MILVRSTDTATGAETTVGRIEAINYVRGARALIQVALYVDADAIADGKRPTSVQNVVLEGEVLDALELEMEPDLEMAVLSTPLFSGATQA